jgi:TonB family protein
MSLSRGGGTGQAPTLAVASGALGGPPAASDAAGGTDTGARRSLAGAMLAGPIADRPVLAMIPPVYPDWAKRDGAEGSVTLYFIVRPDGTVKENVLVQKTAGFQDFDESAQAALRRWRFEPLHGGTTGEQWGTITFHFRLRDAT